MNMQSFTYDGIEYQVEKVVKIDEANGESRFQLKTVDAKSFLMKYNKFVQQWVIDPA
jgi:hypothetical protein